MSPLAEAKRQRLVDLYTDVDIDRSEFRGRCDESDESDESDEQARAIEAQIAQRSDNPVLTEVKPVTYDELLEPARVNIGDRILPE